MDADPYLLQLRNATVDLRANAVRASRASDFDSRAPLARVLAEALHGMDVAAATEGCW